MMTLIPTAYSNKQRWSLYIPLLGAALWCVLAIRDSQRAVRRISLGGETRSLTTHPSLRGDYNHTSPSEKQLFPFKVDFADRKFDLIIWCNKTFDTNRKFIVTRQHWERDGMYPQGEQVLNVDFRRCETNTCPTKNSTLSISDDELQSLWQYIEFVERPLNFLEMESSAIGRHFPLYGIESVSFWSPKHQQHIYLPFTPSKIMADTCGSNQRPCPEPCPQNTDQDPTKYPYIRDLDDGTCKSTHPSALPPLNVHGGPCTCESTCYTPEAGDLNSTWPWKDTAEQEIFRRMSSPTIKTQCENEREQYTMSSYNSRFHCAEEQTRLPCPIYGDFSHHLYFVPKAKLIFCGIPKVGLTEWIKFIRHVSGAKDYLSLPHYKADRGNFLMSGLDISKAEELLNDPTWTKAVFIRNPLDRLLSAYMDKIVEKSYTQTIFKIGDKNAPEDERPKLSFSEFVDKVSDNSTLQECSDPKGLKACTDPHWKPQLMTCGLDYLLPKFDFVGNFDHLPEQTKLLLEKVGLWEEYGATFDDGRDTDAADICAVPPIQRSSDERILGFNQRGPSGSGENYHATESKARFDEFYTPDLIEKVRKAYALDFEVWDQISSEEIPSNRVLSGRDLNVVQSYCDSQVTQK